MIEETMKKGNFHFGKDIVGVAQKIREKRDQKNLKKDFLGMHSETVKNWQEIQIVQGITRKIKLDSK